MTSRMRLRWLAGGVIALLSLVACGGDGADLSANETGLPSATRAAPSPTPLGKPDVVLQLKTPSGRRFVPERFRAPAGSVVKLVYRNLSDEPHAVKIFDGKAPEDPVLGSIRVVTDPKPLSTVFQLPARRGKYLFICPILGHGLVMRGLLVAT